MVVASILYCYWMIFVLVEFSCPLHLLFMVLDVSPNILDITYITCHSTYYIGGFAIKLSSYGVRVVGFIGDHLGGVHMGAGYAS